MLDQLPVGFLRTIEQTLGCTLAYCAFEPTTGLFSSYRAYEATATASTYKLPLLLHIAHQVDVGELRWSQPLTLEHRHRSWGTGILKDLSTGLTLPLQDVCRLMVVLSDNTATDILATHCDLEAVNKQLGDWGFQETRLLSQLTPPHPQGRPPLLMGQTTPAEMVRLLCGVLDASFVSAASSQFILDLLGAQQDRSMIPRLLPRGWHYAGKTGSNADLRADVGIVRDPMGRQVVLALYGQHPASDDWSVDSVGTLALAQLAQAILLPVK